MVAYCTSETAVLQAGNAVFHTEEEAMKGYTDSLLGLNQPGTILCGKALLYSVSRYYIVKSVKSQMLGLKIDFRK